MVGEKVIWKGILRLASGYYAVMIRLLLAASMDVIDKSDKVVVNYEVSTELGSAMLM